MVASKSEKCIVILLDILGFKELIEENDESKILLLLQHFSERNQPTKIQSLGDVKPEISSYSDHIVISISIEQLQKINFNDHNADPLFQYIRNIVSHFYIFALTKGVALRGAIDIGKLYHEKNIIFGKALIECVKLEKKANFPRILLSDNFIKLFNTNVHCSWLVKEEIKKDESYSYLDCFISPQMFHYNDQGITNFELIHEMITTNLSKLTGRPKEKWEWLAKSYNQALNYWKKSCPSDDRVKKPKDV